MPCARILNYQTEIQRRSSESVKQSTPANDEKPAESDEESVESAAGRAGKKRKVMVSEVGNILQHTCQNRATQHFL